jgi:hypothetical protein
VSQVARRLASQQIARPAFGDPADLVRWMGAVQAQDYAGSLWAVGLRLRDGTEAAVEAAIAAGSILRTWPMRGTLHLVPAEDARWMLRLLAARPIALAASRHRQLGLDAAAFAQSRRVLTKALEGGRRLTRAAAYAALARGGVSPDGQRGIHILGQLAQEAVLCVGPREGRQHTFVLLDEWARAPRDPGREEALALLAARYFQGHGPATLADFAWWSGLRMAEARQAIAEAGPALVREGDRLMAGHAREPRRDARIQAVLLPPWDELIVAYRDRSLAVGHLPADRAAGLKVVGSAPVVIDGLVRGAWRRSLTPLRVDVSLEIWPPVRRAERAAVAAAAERYAGFVGRELRLV